MDDMATVSLIRLRDALDKMTFLNSYSYAKIRIRTLPDQKESLMQVW